MRPRFRIGTHVAHLRLDFVASSGKAQELASHLAVSIGCRKVKCEASDRIFA